ncbi:MAG: cobalamin-dependent protein [Dissulfurimicrobium sp.]|uniref:cobalamin-dependent protein n=1 Tax=Dissulfurimicrobium sp. TaxID=2022436 RepID=UPI0040491FAA
MAADAKRINPKILTVVGGTHATIIPADYAKDGIELIVRGEGGTAMREILRRHREGLPLHFDHTYRAVAKRS